MAKRNVALFRKTVKNESEVDEQLMPPGQDGDDDGNALLDQAPPAYHDPLSANEAKRLKDLEGVITRNFGAFYAVGCALREIREKRLYRSTHQRFDFYCRDLWEMKRRTAYQYIDSADVVDTVRTCMADENVRNCAQNENVRHGGQIEWLPQNECQARALLPITKSAPEKIPLLIAEAVRTAPAGQVTASHIKKTARKLHMETVRQAVVKTRQRANSAPKISEDFRKAFNAFLEQINIERMSEYKHTDRKEVIRYVQVIMDALTAEL